MIIQYQEQGVFLDWIRRDELKETLEARLKRGEELLAVGTAQEIAEYLCYWPGRHPREYWLPFLQARIDSLKNRLSKLK